jgi:toxin ParE1/3/4
VSVRLTFHPNAEGELDEAAQYYGRENLALKRAFLDEMRRCVQTIRQNPTAASPLTEQVRRLLARRFPYGVIYSVTSSEIRILAIAHLKRRPLYWAGRQ